MKKLIIASVVIVLVASAGGGWYVFARHGDPMQNARALMQKGDLRGATIQLRNAVRDQPSNGEAHAMLSQAQLRQGDPVAAEKEIKAARDLNWDKAAVLPLLAQAYVAQGKWQDVLAEIPSQGSTPDQTASLLLARAVSQVSLNDPAAANASVAEAERLAPRSVDAHILAARIAIIERDLTRGEAKLNEALAIDPKRADALQLKAQIAAGKGDRTAALALMDQAVDAAPAVASTRLERAGLLLALGQDAKARADVDTVLTSEPRNAGATYLSAVLFVRAGKFTDADQTLQKIDSVITQFPRGLYFQAITKANVGRSEQAVDSASRYVARSPGDPDGVRLLARIELAARRPDRAIATLARAIAAGQRDGETLDLLGRAYAAGGNRVEAEKAFQQASLSGADNAPLLTRLASSRLQMGDLSGAATDLERSLEITPSQTGASEALVATALSMGDTDRAQAALDRLRQQVGETESVGLLAGLLELSRLDPQAALQKFQAVLEKFPNSVQARLNQAKVLSQLGRRPEAIVLLKDMLAKDPANADVLTILVEFLGAENRIPEAISAVEAARAAAPNSLGMIAGQAELYARTGDLPRALSVLDTAKVNGTTPVALLPLLARIQFAAGQTDAAKTTLTSLLAADPANVSARRLLVEFLVRAKDEDGALASIRDGLARAPANPALLGMLIAVQQQFHGLEAALAQADQLRADPANMPAMAATKGDLYMAARRFDDAIKAYSAEYKAAPTSQLAIRLAGALKEAGDENKAAAELRAWQVKQPADPDVAQVLASMDITAQRFAEAERNLQIVLEQRPGNPIALNNLAWIYQTKGDPRARTLAQRAYLQAPSPESSDTLGWILVSQGDAAKGLPLLQQASSARPDNRSTKYHLAVALKAVNQKDAAVALLRPLVDDPVNFDEKAAAKQLLNELGGAKP